MKVNAPEIIILRHAHIEALTEFFSRIIADPASRLFHPHPFTKDEAMRICDHGGLDLYFGLRIDARVVGYGILRGWDEGYSTPSLGIYLLPELRGTGAARLLMQHLHVASQLSGASNIRLKVYPENVPALGLYRAMGYSFDESLSADGQLLGTIKIGVATSEQDPDSD